MADPVWGQLAKAQDDPTTIDEAIAAAVAAHNADPTAHMDTGQSIDVHRKNEIIDHPAFSVLADKPQPTTSGASFMAFDFSKPSSFALSGSGSANLELFYTRVTGISTNNNTNYYGVFDTTDTWFVTDYVFRFDFWGFAVSPGSNYDYWFGCNVDGLGFFDPGGGPNGFGFVLDHDGNAYVAWQKMGQSLEKHSIGSTGYGGEHKYSAEVTTGGSIIFYVDDVQVYSSSTHVPDDLEGEQPFYLTSKKGTSIGVSQFYMSYLLLTKTPNP